MTWRGWLAWAGLGCSVVLGYREDWLASGGAAFGVALLAAWWVWREFAATRARFRKSDEFSAALAKVAKLR